MTTSGKGAAPHVLGPTPASQRVTIDLEDAGDTPILREYRAVKAQFADALVLARLGDFFELFGSDAAVAAAVLGVTLTSRNFGNAGRLPMCGVPCHAASQHIRRLLDAGHRVALWDQVGDAADGRIVRREVTRVLSPGTVTDSALLEATVVRRCVALLAAEGRVGIAALDASVGQLQLLDVAGEFMTPAILEELVRLDVGELIVPDDCSLPDDFMPATARTHLPAAVFDRSRSDDRLMRATGSGTVRALGIDDVPIARRAAGAVIAYCERARIQLPSEFLRVQVRATGDAMRLDAQTRRNLELLTPLSEQRRLSLYTLLNRTCTPMGGRLLRKMLQEPLNDVGAIDRRATAVAALLERSDSRWVLSTALQRVGDLERLAGRAVQGTVTPREMAAIRDSCTALDEISGAVVDIDTPAIRDVVPMLQPADALVRALERTLVDNPPADPRDAGSIRAGVDTELDSLLAAASDARRFIADLERRERERTGIRALRVGYNRVFGYYLEVANSQRDKVPADYVRKQTLVGGERFITSDLKEQEAIVLHTRERMLAREVELLERLRVKVAEQSAALIAAAEAVAMCDVLQGLATVADELRWVRPLVDESDVIDIDDGRHPLVEHALGPGRFVPNDCRLDAAERIVVLTGPNMAGKSTYLRQVALIVLLAQMGSFVPARRARIGVCDRIFTRIGAQDDLSAGMSTFMIEMAETAAILRQATPRSFIVLDEIGRGTSTYDGLSIAQAIIEHIHDAPHLNVRTLFATHYHELTSLAESLTRVRNARVEVEEEGDRVTFLHRIVPGGADRSYGIHVAKLAGIPVSVLLRARRILDELERTRPLTSSDREAAISQLSLDIPPPKHPVLSELEELQVDVLSPLAALNKLAELRERVTT